MPGEVFSSCSLTTGNFSQLGHYLIEKSGSLGMFHVKQIPKSQTEVYRKNTLKDQLKEKGNTHFSEISSNSSINLAAKPSRRNSGATERAVTCPCHSSLATEPSALPITVDIQSYQHSSAFGITHPRYTSLQKSI